MMADPRRAGLAGAVAGLAAAGAGIAARRYLRSRQDRDDESRELVPFGMIRGRPLTVAAEDGVPLHVEVDEGRPAAGEGGARLTLVFNHGYCLDHSSWHYQRSELRHLGRLVFWDQRCHGRSGRCGPRQISVDQLGRDLHAVLRATTSPEDPVVLVGHSMGGMTVMALAEQFPELFGSQVYGAALICTPAGRLTDLTYGFPGMSARAARWALSGVVEALGRGASIVEPCRQLGLDFAAPLVRRYGFSRPDADDAAVRFVNEMIGATPVDVVADFYRALMSHDKAAVLDELRRVDTLVVAGGDDKLAPPAHSRIIADAVPGSRLFIVPRAGHMAMLEWPEVVNDTLRGLARRVRARLRKGQLA